MEAAIVILGFIAGLLVLFVGAMAYARVRGQQKLRTTIENLELSYKRYEDLLDELEGLVTQD